MIIDLVSISGLLVSFVITGLVVALARGACCSNCR